MNLNYKQTELGIIPGDWTVCAIGNLAIKVGSGITPTGGLRVYRSYGRSFIRSQNVGWGELLLDDIVFIDNETHSTFSGTEICIGDIFFNITGASIGRSAVADSRVVGGNVNQHVCIIRVDKNKLASRFLNLFLLSADGQRQINSFQAGGNREGLNFRQVRSILVPIPPTMSEQKLIAETLDDAEKLSEILEKLIVKKNNIKRAIMQQLLTGKIRLPGFSGAWVIKRLGEQIMKLPKTSRPSSVGKVEGRYPFFTNSAKPCDKYLDEYDFNVEAIIANTGGEAYFNYYKGYFAAMADCFVFESRLVTKYLYFLLKLMEQKINNIGFAGSGIKHLDKKHFLDIELYLPSTVGEQEAIANILSDIDDELAILEARRRKTLNIKLAMMQELLTGKTRLVKAEATHA